MVTMNKLMYAKKERRIGISGFDEKLIYILILDQLKTTTVIKVYQ